jgi:hypothetical protein
MNSPHIPPTEAQDDSQIALRIAGGSAFIVAIFFLGISLLPTSFASIRGPIEIFAKSLSVVVALVIMHSRIEEAQHIPNRSNIPFLSTFFFYGITLLLVYLGQIGYVIFHLLYVKEARFLAEMQFLLGVDSFTSGAILSAFFAGHIPFLVYYFFLKFRLQKMIHPESK